MNPDPTRQAELFRKMAAGYDAAIRVYQPSYDDMLRLSTDLVSVAAPALQRCLDYGAGTGAALPYLAKCFGEVVAVDPATAMLDVARARVRRELGDDATRVQFLEGTTASPRLAAEAEGSFDAVHCSMVLMFVEGDEAKLSTLRALRRMLTRGGVLVQTEVLADPREQETFALWRDLMRFRGASEEQVATAEHQVHSLMHRRTEAETRALLDDAGFARVTQAYQSLHTAVFVAWSES